VQRILLTAISAICISQLAIQSSAQAGIATGDTIRIQTGGTFDNTPVLVPGHSDTLVGHGAGGGEFLMTVIKNGVDQSTTGGNVDSMFLSFCTERNEYIANGGVYDVLLSPSAANGGISGGNPDSLDVKTQSLFQQYYLGTLDDTPTSFDYNDAGDANAFQDVIWFLEQEITTLPLGLATDLWNLALAYDPNLGVVGVARLYSNGANNSVNPDGTLAANAVFNQDQLIMLPGQNIEGAPEAASVISWCFLGLAGCGYCWRRRRC